MRLTLASWQPIGTLFPIGNASDNFYGRGTLMVENISQQALTLYMPVGTLFPPATAGQQTMAGYTTNVQTSNPQPTQQQGQPSQLPNTAEGGQSPSLLLFGAALALLALGYWLRLRLTPR